MPDCASLCRNDDHIHVDPRAAPDCTPDIGSIFSRQSALQNPDPLHQRRRATGPTAGVDVKHPLQIAAVDAALAETDPQLGRDPPPRNVTRPQQGLRPIYERALLT